MPSLFDPFDATLPFGVEARNVMLHGVNHVAHVLVQVPVFPAKTRDRNHRPLAKLCAEWAGVKHVDIAIPFANGFLIWLSRQYRNAALCAAVALAGRFYLGDACPRWAIAVAITIVAHPICAWKPRPLGRGGSAPFLTLLLDILANNADRSAAAARCEIGRRPQDTLAIAPADFRPHEAQTIGRCTLERVDQLRKLHRWRIADEQVHVIVLAVTLGKLSLEVFADLGEDAVEVLDCEFR